MTRIRHWRICADAVDTCIIKQVVRKNDMYDGDTFDISDVILEHQNVGRWKGSDENPRDYDLELKDDEVMRRHEDAT